MKHSDAYLGDLTAFVVASQNSHTVLVADFEGNQERHRLDRVVATVNVISHKQVVGVGRIAANAKQLHQVMKLPMDISTHLEMRTGERR